MSSKGRSSQPQNSSRTEVQNSSKGDRKASIKDSPEVEAHPGYHGYMPREEVNRLLRNAGDFLLRQTELSSGEGFQLVLSVRVGEKACHFPITVSSQGRFYVNRRILFDTVSNLVNHYKESGDEINEKTQAICRNFIPRQPWELHRNQIHVDQLLGHGEFGAVHSGTLKINETEYPVAVKLHKVKALKKEMITDFLNEARLLREYKHPNIVQFYGVSIDKEPIMLCMELADGGSLDTYLRKRKGNSTASQRLQMCVDAARGLTYLHSKNCIHRDVSARNCLVADKRIKISDFGLAHQLAQALETTNTSNLEKMPVRWLAPEAMSGTSSIKSDVYSFGVLMWEIYTDAETPFKNKTLLQVFEGVQNKGLKLERPAAMDEKIAKIMIEGCFAHEPEARWPMAKVCEQLEKRMKKQETSAKSARSEHDEKRHKEERKKSKHQQNQKPESSKHPKSARHG